MNHLISNFKNLERTFYTSNIRESEWYIYGLCIKASDVIEEFVDGHGSFLPIEQRLLDLMEYYSLLEIASIAGVIPSKGNFTENSDSKVILGNKDIRRFCENRRLILPQLFHLRQSDLFNLGEHESPMIVSFFFRFLFINRVRLDNWDLRHFAVAGHHRNQSYILAELKNDDEVLKGLMGQGNFHIKGFFELINYLCDLEQLLLEMSGNLILQSAFWHYSNIFIPMSKNLKLTIDEGFEILEAKQAKWKLQELPEEVLEIGTSLPLLRASMRRLFSGEYSRFLEEAVFDHAYDTNDLKV
ncbi:MAG TPA: hypothetical protein VK826_15130 [Bacteroidia bacterium]|nr:hypothetical protein [Bacteroidia bacterium]